MLSARIGFVFLVALIGGVCAAQSVPQRAEPSAVAQIRHGLSAVREGRFAEACGAADLVLLNETVRVAVDPDAEPAVREAIRTWECALNDGIRIEIVSPCDDPDVTVRAVPQITHGNRNSIGFSHWRRSLYPDGRFRLQAEIELAERYPSGTKIDGEGRLHAALHEFGHLLGLDDSHRVGDVMGPIDPGRPVCTPRAAEIDALKALRELARDLREEAANLAQMNLGGYNFDREIG